MAKPKLALIPAAQGSKFYSVLPSSGVGDFDFTRSGSATRINSQGLIETVASGVSRLNYPMIDGVVKGCPSHILEPQRLQRVQYSEDFSQGYWIKSDTTITSNATISPDGTLNATKLLENSNNSVHRITPNSNVSIASDVSMSVFVKAAEREWVMIRESAQTGAFAYFNVKDGYVGQIGITATAKIEDFGNGWFRCTISKNATSALLDIRICQSDGVNLYQGDGTSGIYIFGAQVESGSYATSYIPNYGTAAGVTRSAETANGSGSAATFNDSEGVLMAEISALADDGTVRSIAISGSVTNDVVRFYYDGVSNGITAFVYNGAYQSVFTTVVNDINENNKIAFSYKLNEFKLFINGLQVGVTDTNGAIPNGLDGLKFDNGYGAEDFYGNVKQLQYFDTALNSEDLEKLTSWVSFQDMAEGQLYTIE